MREVVIGIDIGGTNTQYGFVDQNGICFLGGTVFTQEYDHFNGYIEALYKSIMKTAVGSGEDVVIKGIGFGAPNGNYHRGTIEHAINLRWKGILRVIDTFKTYLDVPMALTNDANAAAFGEMKFGKAKGMKDFIVITLGTGLGSGIVTNGKMMYGSDGFAGELGHLIVDNNGRICGCGRRGCLETYASATGIKRTVYELMAKRNDKSELRRIAFNDLSAKMITSAARQNDPIALAAFEETGKVLGRKLADIVAFTSPEAIFLFGGLALAGDVLLNPTRSSMNEAILNIFRDKVKLELSGLMDENIAVLGAAALAWQELATRKITIG